MLPLGFHRKRDSCDGQWRGANAKFGGLLGIALLLLINSYYQGLIKTGKGYSQMDKLMVSVSGVRGVIGEGLTPDIITRFAAAFGTFTGGGKIVVGRDTRVTGEMVMAGVLAGLESVGCDVIDVGICPTPTIQLAVGNQRAAGGIAITASHNPIQWNALKLISSQGIFLDEEQGREVLNIVEKRRFNFVPWDKVGHRELYEGAIGDHIEAIMNLNYIDVDALRERGFKVVIDCVNGAGGTLIPELLERLGCRIIELNCKPDGLFPRNPEPLPENLGELCSLVKKEKADVGFAVDPDADRLAIVSDKGIPLGEEYTLALAVKFILEKKPGIVVVNASTTRAIDDIAGKYGIEVVRTKVGEIHVAKKMKEVGAVIGGEGNGGVILPDLHLGRDAPVGIALTLQHLLEFGGSLTDLYHSLPQYFMVKRKVQLGGIDLGEVMGRIEDRYRHQNPDLTDGVKLLWEEGWVHLRKSNTEPVIRVIAEARTKEKAERTCEEFVKEIKGIELAVK